MTEQTRSEIHEPLVRKGSLARLYDNNFVFDFLHSPYSNHRHDRTAGICHGSAVPGSGCAKSGF